MKTSDLLSHLIGVKQVGREHWLALCPCHDDHRPSLDVAVKNGKTLIYCPVCGADGVRVTEALGLNARNLFENQRPVQNNPQRPQNSPQRPQNSPQRPQNNPQRPRNVDYFYSPVLKKTRFYTFDSQKQAFKKSFCWYHKTEKGWEKGLPKGADGRSIAPPLYHRELLTVARERGKRVYICEGEKDVETLIGLGFLAVCSPHGAGRGKLESKWTADYSAAFEGLEAVILPDNDEAGQNLARYIANQILPVAKSVRVPDLTKEWDTLPEKGDITDVLETETPIKGKTVAETVAFRLEALTDCTPEYKAPRESSPFICLSDVETAKTDWLWYPYIPLGKITLMTADPGTGKTFMALYLAAQTSRGAPFYGTNDAWREPANVVYQTAEDGIADTIKPRLEPMKPRFENIFVFDESKKSLSLSDENIERIMQELHPRLMVFDPLQAYLGADVDMHRANEVRPVLGHIGHLAEKYNCAVIFIMHHSKATQNAALHRALGSMDIPAVARSMLILAKNPEGGKLMCHEKSSLAKHGQSICFDIAPHSGGIIFSGFSELKADDVLNLRPEPKKKPAPKRDELCEKILEMFGEEKEIEVPTRQELCERLGCSGATLKRAKAELGIKTIRKGYSDKAVHYWRLDADDDDD